MAELQALNRKRGTLKSRITTFKNFLAHVAQDNPNETQALNDEAQEQLKQRVSRIKDTLSEFEEIQETIEELSEDVAANTEARESFENNYYQALASASKLLCQGTVQLQTNEQATMQTDQAGPSQVKMRSTLSHAVYYKQPGRCEITRDGAAKI